MWEMGMQGMGMGKLGTQALSRSSGIRLSCLGEGCGGFVLGVGAKRKQPLNCSLLSSCHPGRRRPRAEQSFAFANQ